MIGIQGGIHTYNITNSFKQCYIPLVPIHVCMQQIYLPTIKYLASLIINKQNLKNQQQQIISTYATTKPQIDTKIPRLNPTT